MKKIDCLSFCTAHLVVGLLLFAVVTVSGDGPTTCLCDNPVDSRCSNGYCNVTDPNIRGCRISTQYFPKEDPPFLYRVHTCVFNDLFDFIEYCNNGVDDPGPVHYKKLGDFGDAEICCTSGDNCNTEELYLSLTQNQLTTTAPGDPSSPDLPGFFVPVLTFLCMVVMIVVLVIVATLSYCLVKYKGLGLGICRKPSPSGTPTATLTSLEREPYDELSNNDSLEFSGSGAGQPMLIARSIARQVTLQEIIGQGRFGQVWKGSLKGDEVAVKIFHGTEEMSWKHEVEIYQTCLMTHHNILRFIVADSRDTEGMANQFWLLTEFCEYGSLYDLLNQQSFSEEIMLKLCYTAVCGLDHLHSEIVGTQSTQSKPMIAHRDLKSRNILVKSDFICCIADLGLSLRSDRFNEMEDLSKRVGTKRYLAPEVIDEEICFHTFNSFKMADIYSFGLVLWEIARRGECDGIAEEPELPYYETVPVDPTFEDMKKVLVVENRRPTISNKWSNSEIHLSLTRIMAQCWNEDPEARLTTLRIKKSIGNLCNFVKVKKTEQS